MSATPHTRSRRLVAALVALLLPIGVVFATTPGGAAVAIECCCGAHDSHEDCHCPDCPVSAALADEDRRRSGDPAALVDRIGRCGQQLPPVFRHVDIHWYPPAPPDAVVPVPVLLAAMFDELAPPSRLEPPEAAPS